MKTVPLGGGIAAGRVALVDDGDFDLVMQYRWTVQEQTRTGRTHGPYAITNAKGRTLLMHKLITDWPLVDHADGNGLNNQQYNLRPASRGQNQWNSGSRGGSSQFKGVHWASTERRWIAQITVGGRPIVLGRFSEEVEAARAYDSAAVKFHGEFARLNFPSEVPAEWNGTGGPKPPPVMRGEQHARARLTEAAVIDIRSQHAQRTASLAALGRAYGVSVSTVWLIVHRRTWDHVA